MSRTFLLPLKNKVQNFQSILPLLILKTVFSRAKITCSMWSLTKKDCESWIHSIIFCLKLLCPSLSIKCVYDRMIRFKNLFIFWRAPVSRAKSTKRILSSRLFSSIYFVELGFWATESYSRSKLTLQSQKKKKRRKKVSWLNFFGFWKFFLCNFFQNTWLMGKLVLTALRL